MEDKYHGSVCYGQCVLDLVLGGGYTKHGLDIHKQKSTKYNEPIGHLLVNPHFDSDARPALRHLMFFSIFA